MKENAVKLRNIDPEFLNADFWNDENKIKSYCQAILKYFGKENNNIVIQFSKDIAKAGQNASGSQGCIILPQMPVVFQNDEERYKQIYMRSIILKHELSHLLFTDYKWQYSSEHPQGFPSVVNWIDDIRIEYQFSQTLKGSYRSFRELRYVIFRNNKIDIENSDPNPEIFCAYVHYRLMGFKFDNTPIIQFYEKHFSGFENIIYLNDEEYKIRLRDFYDVAMSIKPDDPEIPEIPEEDFPKIENPTENENRDDSDTPDHDPSVDYDIDDDEMQNSLPQESEDGQPEESEDGEESENSEREFSDVEDLENFIEDQFQKEYGEELEPSDEEKSDGSESEGSESEGSEDEGSEDEESETEKTEEEISDNLETGGSGNSKKITSDIEVEDDDALEQELKDNDISEESFEELDQMISEDIKSLDDLAKDLVDTQVSLRNFEDLNFYESDFPGAIELNLIDICKVFKTRAQSRTALPKLDLPKGLTIYRQVVQKNQKVISECIRFLKLKVQHRTFNRKINFQEEGLLDQTNLKEVVINRSNPRAFYRNVEKIESKSRMHILMDASGSMNRSQISICIENAIILTEVAKALDLDLGIHFFTSGLPHLKFNKQITKKLSPIDLKNAFKKIIDRVKVRVTIDGSYWNTQMIPLRQFNGDTIDISGIDIDTTDKPGTIVTIKEIVEKHNKNIEIALGNLFDQVNRFVNNFHGGTPEFECVTQVFRDNINTEKNIMFIINDGQYDDSFIKNIKTDHDHNRRGIVNAFEYFSETSTIDAVEVLKEFDFQFERLKIGFQNIKNNDSFKKSILNRLYFGDKLNSSNVDKYIDASIALCEDELFPVIRKGIVNMANKIGIIKGGHQYEVTAKNLFMEEAKQINDSRIIINPGHLTINDGYLFLNIGNWIVDDVTKRILFAISDIVSQTYSPANIAYTKIIERMRNIKNWKIYGIGIASEMGLRYIGSDKFMVIKSESEMSTTFSKKLREIF